MRRISRMLILLVAYMLPSLFGSAIANNPRTGFAAGEDSETITFTFTECDDLTALSPGDVVICESVCLFDLLLGTPPTGGSWLGPSGWQDNTGCGTFDIATDPLGEYTYTVLNPDEGLCSVTMNVVPIDLGIVSNTVVCDSDTLNLYEEIPTIGDESPDGTWTDENGNVIPDGIIYDSATYLYQFTDVNGCSTTAQVAVTFAYNPPVADAYAEVCSNETTVCPFYLLEGNPGEGVGLIHYSEDGSFISYSEWNACFSIENINDGDYFTYILGSPPCAPQYINIYIDLIDSPQTPTNTSAFICSDESPIYLDSLLLGTDETNWEWTDPLTGNTIDNILNPEDYPQPLTIQLQYSAGTGLCSVSGLLALTIQTNEAYAGESAIVEICENSSPINMFLELGGTPQIGGVWTGPSPSFGGGNFYSPAIHTPGIYTYIVASSCGEDSATITISEIIGAVNPPTNSYAAICQDTGIVNLDTLLYGTNYLGWEWSDENGIPVNNPIDISDFPPSGNVLLNYSGGTPPCQTTGEFTLYFSSPADTAQTYIEICTGQNTLCLFDYVEGNPPEGGVWAEVDENGVYINFYQEYDVCLDITNISGSSSYKYIKGIPPCYPQWPLLNVDFINTPSSANTSVTLCTTLGDVVLNTLLNGNVPANGQWIDPTGISIGNTINTETATSGTYSYNIDNGPCTGTSLLTLSFETTLDAGPDINLSFCGDGSLINLYEYIDPSADIGAFPIQSIVLLPINSGVYTYNTVGGNQCPSDFANYTINIEEELSITDLTETCNSTGTEYTVSFTIIGTPPFIVNGITNSPILGNAFVSSPIPAGTPYNFSISDSGLCQDFSVSGFPDCQCETAYSTLTTTNDSICEGICTDLIFQLVGDGPFTAVYSDGFLEYTLTDISNGHTLETCPTETTNYTLLNVAGMNCPPTPSANQSVAISVFNAPSAGPDVTLDFCPDNSEIYLYDYLHPDASNMGYFPTLYDTIVALTSNSGIYPYYTNANVCESDSSFYTINIYNPGNCTFEVGGGNQGISINPGADIDGGRPTESGLSEFENHDIASEKNQQIDFTLFPNPLRSHQKLHLSISGLHTAAILKIHDLTGRIVWTGVIHPKHKQSLIELQSLPSLEAGIYLISIVTPRGNNKSKTLMIEK